MVLHGLNEVPSSTRMYMDEKPLPTYCSLNSLGQRIATSLSRPYSKPQLKLVVSRQERSHEKAFRAHAEKWSNDVLADIPCTKLENRSKLHEPMRQRLLTVLVLALAGISNAQLVISSSSVCFGEDVYAFYFSETTFLSDHTIKISPTTPFPDLTIQVVNNPSNADIVLIDNFNNANLKVCNSSTSFGATTIRLSETATFPDITIKLTNQAPFADYTLYVQSTRITIDEAAALVGIIWDASQNPFD